MMNDWHASFWRLEKAIWSVRYSFFGVAVAVVERNEKMNVAPWEEVTCKGNAVSFDDGEEGYQVITFYQAFFGNSQAKECFFSSEVKENEKLLSDGMIHAFCPLTVQVNEEVDSFLP